MTENEEKRSGNNLEGSDSATIGNCADEAGFVASSDKTYSSVIEEVLEEIQEQKDEKDKEETEPWQEKYVRLLADFDNYRKNVSKQIFDLQKYEGERIFRELIEIVDDLERALSYVDPEKIKLDPVLSGVELTLKNIMKLLKRFEVAGESVVGSKFDPTTMEAIQRIEDDTQEEGIVVKEFKKLYKFKDKILRFAEVAVSAKGDKC
ncbi:MAG: nucleotide exchange factor GrpE [Deltaproteobacteria bacterium]|nr:nucleotide exchange factor GrpE [Deltaproteobacteria bacterium]